MCYNPVGSGMAELKYSRMTARLGLPGRHKRADATEDVWRVHYDALARVDRGEDVIVLSVGDPDFDTPEYIIDHVVERLREGRTHYSAVAGEEGLRDAIANLETAGTGKTFVREQILIFPGATAALYAVFAAILDEGDGVLVPEPMYIGYQGVFEAIGAEVQQVPLQAPGFELDLALLFASVKSNTKAVLINTPGNPCGNVIPPSILNELARECRARGLWLVCDEVYSLITFETPHVSMLKCIDDLSNVIVIDGLSKSHAMTGWRVGWVVADAPMVSALANISNAAFFSVCQFVQDGAQFALENDAREVEAMRRAYQRRRDYVLQRIDQIDGLGYYRPEAGMFVMVDCSAVANGGSEFAERLLEQAGVSTIPGIGFGPSANDYVRLSLTLDEAGLGTAFDRIEAFLG